MDVMGILLMVLAIVAVWAVVELALTIRKARTTIDELTHSATEVLDQTAPLIVKADGVIDDLQPTLRDLGPMVERVNVVLDEATISLDGVNNILGDVSSATHGVAGVGESASRIVNTATSAAVGVVSKVASLGGITIPEGQQLIGKGVSQEDEEPQQPQVSEPKPTNKTSYVTYAPVSGENAEE
ncbi:MAG: hypothetical protein J6D34_03540 [Atopobiaceae bacterium]|nr:hypothetical protein [Atopobiaceae bacterium]